MEVENYSNNNHLKKTNKLSVTIKSKSENQEKLIQSIQNNQYTICAGKPGTGKTLLSCYEALKLLHRKDLDYKKIILTKSVLPLSTTEAVGFIKGSLEEKFSATAESFMDSFHKILGETETNNLIRNGSIDVIPVSFLRGRSLSDILIIDEAQNFSIEVIHTILTRMETGSRLIMLGDVKQQDLRGNSGFETVLRKFKDVPNFGIVELNDEKDVQRNPMINVIEKIFDDIIAKK